MRYCHLCFTLAVQLVKTSRLCTPGASGPRGTSGESDKDGDDDDDEGEALQDGVEIAPPGFSDENAVLCGQWGRLQYHDFFFFAYVKLHANLFLDSRYSPYKIIWC
jgi:hypothetical protein